ncbi:MAG: MarR family transcriptional regulator [Kiloniellales bacterium]|nr:MarR family transcriptional regulator [Kiloniellales bacterium]
MLKGPSTAVVSAWAQLLRAQQAVLAAVEADIKKVGFPPLSWYDILLELSREQNGTLRPQDLEKRVLLKQYSVSRLLDRLQQAGYVTSEKLAEDRRGRVVTITEAGRMLLKDMWPTYANAIERHVGSKVDPREASSLSQLLAKLTQPSD